MSATITAYCACALCCGQPTGICADGHHPREGVTIAAPRFVPLGTLVQVRFVDAGSHWPAGFKLILRVQDRTARKYDGRFDIYFRNHRDAKRFGKRRAEITIIK